MRFGPNNHPTPATPLDAFFRLWTRISTAALSIAIFAALLVFALARQILRLIWGLALLFIGGMVTGSRECGQTGCADWSID